MNIIKHRAGKTDALMADLDVQLVGSRVYANDFTSLIPDIYDAMDVVSRNLSGFVTSAMRAPGVERAAVGQSVSYPIAPAQSTVPIVPSMTIPTPAGQSYGIGQMAITRAEAVEFGITGEEQRGLNSGGPGFQSVQSQWIGQALATLTDMIELDGAVEASAHASRAVGVAGTNPFAAKELDPIAEVKRILDENGAPRSTRSLVLGTQASAKFITINNLTRVNEAGSTMTLRQGELMDVFGFSVKDTAQSVRHTAGNAANATTDAAGYPVGATTINLAGAGTGAFLPGDVIRFAGDANQYEVAAGDPDVSNGGSVTIASPGLRQTIPAQATAVSSVGNYNANVGFSADALHVAMRPPAEPVGGDAATDSMMVTDPRSGIQYEIRAYKGYHMNRWEIGLAWGWKATKPAHIALLLG